MTNKTYKLIGLQIEGIRLIKAAQLKFKPSGLTEIVGKNNQGKSSIIDAIEILFEGFKQKVDDIITHGEEKAVIIGDLDEFTIKRVMTQKSDRLEVLTKNGMKPQKPQDFLNSLINKLTFRPQVFLDKKPEEKLKSVMEILKIDFSQDDRQITLKENDRLLAGRELKGLGEKIEPEKVDPVDTAELLNQKQVIENFNKEENKKQLAIDYFNGIQERVIEAAFTQFREKYKDPVTGIFNRDSLPGHIENIVAGLLKIEKCIVEDVIMHLPAPACKSTEEIDEKIRTASETNAKAQAYKDYVTWQANKAKKQEEYDKLTKEIADLRAGKIKKLAQIEMPVKGLIIKEVTENNYGLFYNNIFCENWSTSLGWKVSLGICAAMQPDLRAVFLDNGESLDSDTRKELDKWAIANNIQVILTIVDKIPDSLQEGSFYIEEGRIFNNEGDCVPKEETTDTIQPEPQEPVKKDKPRYDTQSLF